MHPILIISKDNFEFEAFIRSLDETYYIYSARDFSKAEKMLSTFPIKVVIVEGGQESNWQHRHVQTLKMHYNDILFIIVSAKIDYKVAYEMRNTELVHDFLTEPWSARDLLISIESACRTYELKERNKLLIKALEFQNAEIKLLKGRIENKNFILTGNIELNENFQTVITEDAGFKAVLKKAEHISLSDITILIEGETGTGKELVASAIFRTSRRVANPYVKINCATMSGDVIDSELFGHKKGAFTGAIADRRGLFEYANGGTVFLDEIGELSLEMQAKLLRLLQEGEYRRVGDNQIRQTDVRIIAATNKNLEHCVKENKFREDLYYRLNVISLHLPPLRQRKSDIPILADYFIQKYSRKYNKSITAMSSVALDLMIKSNWPGNVRELENFVERNVLLSTTPIVSPDELERVDEKDVGNQALLTLETIEREHILKALENTKGKIGGKNGAAEVLGIKRTTLIAKIQKLGIKIN